MTYDEYKQDLGNECPECLGMCWCDVESADDYVPDDDDAGDDE